MNRLQLQFTLLLITLYSFIFSADAPDGFASVSGKGLSTTTGGEGGETVIVNTLADLQKYASSSEPYIILVQGTIAAVPKGTNVNVKSNKTIVGLGNDATLYQGELHLVNVSNVIIRNLIIRDSYVEGNYDCKDTDWDGIQIDESHHIWIDHCLLTHNCDGLIDLRKACDYVTVSWVHFSNHNKCFGVGWTDETDFRTTIHHCWFDSTNQRNPSFDMGIGHLYNNYVRKVSSYGNYARGEARVVIENSVFEDSKNPVQADATAKLFISGLQFSRCTGTQTGNVSTPPFNPKDYYDYTLDKTSDVKNLVISGAGPQEWIGKQYLPVNNRKIPANPFLNAVSASVSENRVISIKVDITGRHRFKIYSPNGKILKVFEGTNPSVYTCRVPSGGMYLISFQGEKHSHCKMVFAP